jgi:predicted naringenin-chalcone synthase
MPPHILGLGTAVPPIRISQQEALAAARILCAEDEDHEHLLETLYVQSGIESRHVVFQQAEVDYLLHGRGHSDSPFIPTEPGDPGPSTALRMLRYESHALPLAIEASSAALQQALIQPQDITHLVTVSCTGFAAPGVDLGLIRDLGLPPTTERVHVGFMGCHGSLNALRVARGLHAADPSARILLASVELCSLHYAYGWNPRKIVGNALFADGAGALVLGNPDPAPPSPPNSQPQHNGSYPPRRAWSVAATGSCVFPGSEPAMAWHIRDHGFDMILSSRVPTLIQHNLLPFLERWLDRQNLALADIASWAVHPGGPRVLSCVQSALHLPPDALEISRQILASHGNMSSATVLFILRQLIEAQAPAPCLALGFGPGLCAEVALFL